MGQWIELKAADGQAVTAWQAEPAGAPRGAVVVLQEIFGVNAHIRAVAEGYAAEGYLALAPATFGRVRAGVDLGYDEAAMQTGMGLKRAAEALPAPGVLPDIQAAIDHARQAGAGKVGVVGFCWGGLLAWRAASGCAHLSWRAASGCAHLSAAVCYYGGGMTAPAELALQPRVPVQAHLSDNDKSVPLEGVAALRQAHPAVDVHLYPAPHGFNCDRRAAWNEAAATLARQRTLAFFAQHLR
ncbi:MAG: dienelactone hydrolase family protein [Burkholderiales bacterium]|nr:dienelactone hydrolase family protein [Burkholderiales bacterium]MBS0402063.1 dienelactone hydrolase family protein [Pseudomonadota bacterium]